MPGLPGLKTKYLRNISHSNLSVAIAFTLLGLLITADRATAQPTFSMDAQGPSMVVGVASWPVGPFFEGDILSPPLPGPPLGTPSFATPPPGVTIVGAFPAGLMLAPAFFQEVDALSYGTDDLVPETDWLIDSFYFSVDEFATGDPAAGGAPSVLTEGAFGPNFEAAADTFTNAFTIPVNPPPPPPAPGSPPAGNVAVTDGDGLPNVLGTVYAGVGLIEPDSPFVVGAFSLDPGDNLDAVDMDTLPGDLADAIFFSLDCAFADPLEPPPAPPNFGSAVANGFVGGDVLEIAFPGDPAGPFVYAPAAVLGLDLVAGPDTDDLDALILAENGIPGYQASVIPYDWVFGVSDMLLFSVRRGSAVIGFPDSRYGAPIAAGDILTTPLPAFAGGLSPFPAIFIPAEHLGLATIRNGTAVALFGPMPFDDDLDALDYIERPDCNDNDVWDAVDIATGTSLDCNSNGVPDECEPDCNNNNVPDVCDIADGTSLDCNANTTPDECETDCNGNNVPDDCDITDGTSYDCNTNARPDECDLAGGTSNDCDNTNVPDECEDDCNDNGIEDACDIADGTSNDCNANTVPDECDVVASPLSFSAGASYATGGFGDIALGDLNGDRIADLVRTNRNGDSFHVRFGNGDGTFDAESTFATGDEPIRVRIIDMNHDSDEDVVVLNANGRSVQVFHNNGLGTAFLTVSLSFTGAPPDDLAIGDFDNDGDLDVAVTQTTDSVVRVLSLNAFGSSIVAQATYAVSSPRGIVAGDMNLDGRLDLLVASNLTDSIGYFMNNGAGFNAVISYATISRPVSIALADLDWINDQNSANDPDVIVGNAPPGSATSDSVAIHLNEWGLLTPLTSISVGVAPASLRVLDLDGDGRDDIVAACRGSGAGVGRGVYVLRNISTVFSTLFTSVGTVDTGSIVWALDAARLDADRDPELALLAVDGTRIVTNRSSSASLDLNANNLPDECETDCNLNNWPDALDLGAVLDFERTTFGMMNRGAGRVVAADFDLDGDADVVTVGGAFNNPMLVSRNDGSGAFNTAMAPPGLQSQGYASVAVADVDRDGLLDLVLADSWFGRVLVSRNTMSSGVLSFAAPSSVTTAAIVPNDLVAADFDGDGDADVVFVEGSFDRLSVIRNTTVGGSISFSAPTSVAAGDNPISLLAADLDEDGDLDVVLHSFLTNALLVFLNNGSATFAAGASIPFSSFSSSGTYALADLDRDGDPDLITPNTSTDRIEVRLNNGNATFAAAVSYDAGRVGAYRPAVADFDGDGNVDIAVMNYLSTLEDYLSILPGNGDGSFATRRTLDIIRRYPGGILAVDADRDARTDLLVNSAGGLYSLLNRTIRTGNAAQVFSAAPSLAIPGGPGTTTTPAMFVNNAGRIEDLDVTVNITHPYPQSLALRLNHPDGTGVVLANFRSGFGPGFVDTTFDDDAGFSFIAAQAPLTGRFQPAPGTLASLSGKLAYGNWTLSVIDNSPGDAGTINSWALTFRTAIDDCNGNSVPDACDIAGGTPDVNGDNVPDSCESLFGDMDGDTDIDGDDIAAFIACLYAGSSSGPCAAADIDGDTDVDDVDVMLFIGLLLGL
ncbi:MAG: FG-GAP-like repeat-containing protein [Phycisphaerae bacterium]|nr:FG-GAP-like repeat-containing protein [Phycisphaerae bacterium]